MNESHSDQFADYNETIRRILLASKTPTVKQDASALETTSQPVDDYGSETFTHSHLNPNLADIVPRTELQEGNLTSSMLDSIVSIVHQPRQSPVVEILSHARVEIEKNRQEIDMLRTSLQTKDMRLINLEKELTASRHLNASMAEQFKAQLKASSIDDLHITTPLMYSFNMQTQERPLKDAGFQTDLIADQAPVDNSETSEAYLKLLAKFEQVQSEYEVLKVEHEDFHLKLASTKSESEFSEFKALLEYNKLKATHENTITQIKAVEVENSLMDQQLRELTSQIEVLTGDNTKLLSKISLLESELSATQAKYDSVKDQSATFCQESKRVEDLLKEKISKCIEETVILRAENAELSRRLDDCLRAYTSKSEELSAIVKQHEEAMRTVDTANDELQKQLRDLEGKILAQQQTHDASTSNITMALDEAIKAKEALEKELQSTKKSLAQTSETVNILTAENASLRETMDRSNASIVSRMDAAIAANKASFKLQLAQLERELETARLEASVSTVKLDTQVALVAQGQKEIDILKISLNTAENTISSLQQTLTSYTNEGELKQRLTTTIDQNSSLTERIQELEAEIAKRKAKEHTLSKDLEFLKENADSLAKKCERRGLAKAELQAALKERDTQLTKNIQEASAMRSELLAQITGLEATARKDAESLKRLTMEREELDAQISMLQTETSRFKAELSKKAAELEKVQASAANASHAITAENKSLLHRLEQTTNEASQLRLSNQQTVSELLRIKQEAERLRQMNAELNTRLSETAAKNTKIETQTNNDIEALSTRIEEMIKERQVYEKERQELLATIADKESSLDAAQITISSQLSFKKIADSLAAENSALRLELEQMRLGLDQMITEASRQKEEIMRKNINLQSTLTEKSNALEVTVGLLKEGKETVQQLQQEKNLLLQKLMEQQSMLTTLQNQLAAKDAEHSSQMLQLELQTQEYAAELRQLTDLHNNYRKSVEADNTAVAEKLNALAEINKEMIKSSHHQTPRSRSSHGSLRSSSVVNSQLPAGISGTFDRSTMRAYNFLDKTQAISNSTRKEKKGLLDSITEEVLRLTMLREGLQSSVQNGGRSIN